MNHLDALAATRGVVLAIGLTMAVLTVQTAVVDSLDTLPMRYVLVVLGGLAAGVGIVGGLARRRVSFYARRRIGVLLMAYSLARGASFGLAANDRAGSWWGFITSTALTVWLGLGLLLGFVILRRAQAEQAGRVLGNGWSSSTKEGR